jgi:hypothetical protein
MRIWGGCGDSLADGATIQQMQTPPNEESAEKGKRRADAVGLLIAHHLLT